MIESQIMENPDLAVELYTENEVIIKQAENLNNITRLKNEYEQAYESGLSHFINNRGYQLLLMKNQDLLLMEYVSLLIIPIVFVYIDFKRRMNTLPYKSIISVSKTGYHSYSRKCDRNFMIYSLLCTMLLVLGHIVKIQKFFTIKYTYTLQDIMYYNLNLPVFLFMVLFVLMIQISIYIISRIIIMVTKLNKRI